MYVNIFENYFVFLQGDIDSDLGEPVFLGRTMPNTIYYQFQKQTFLVADKCVGLDGITIDARYIAITVQWYEQIPGISGSDLVYILHCNNPLQVQSHTKLVHGKISMTHISGNLGRHTTIGC